MDAYYRWRLTLFVVSIVLVMFATLTVSVGAVSLLAASVHGSFCWVRDIESGAGLICQPTPSDSDEDRQPPASGRENCVEFDSNTCVKQARDRVDQISRGAENDDKFRDEIRKQSKGNPRGSGPWPFVVVDITDGLVARTTNEFEGDRVGYAAERSLVFADCSANSSFNPHTNSNVGPVWLRVKWKSDQPSEDLMQSHPSDRYDMWMYKGHLVPFGHNGRIPECD